MFNYGRFAEGCCWWQKCREEEEASDWKWIWWCYRRSNNMNEGGSLGCCKLQRSKNRGHAGKTLIITIDDASWMKLPPWRVKSKLTIIIWKFCNSNAHLNLTQQNGLCVLASLFCAWKKFRRSSNELAKASLIQSHSSLSSYFNATRCQGPQSSDPPPERTDTLLEALQKDWLLGDWNIKED